MSFATPNIPLFGGEQEFDTRHVITTDSVDLAELGFSSFSIPEIEDWIEKPSNAALVGTVPRDSSFFSTPKVNTSFRFSYWRNTGRNGQYIDFNDMINNGMNWSYGATYTAADLIFPPGNFADITTVAIQNDHITKLIRHDPNGLTWGPNDKATMEWLVDIKSSKKGCIQWTATITFSLPGQARREEEVGMSLYLYDDVLEKKTSRPVTVSNMKVVAPRVDNNGREYRCKEDGSPCSVDNPDHPNENVAASIDVSFNELNGKWESGTPQVVGMLTTDIAGASGVNLSKMLNNDIVDLLDPFAGQGVSTGSAIPIRMQNANPMQWSPDYKEFEDVGPRTDHNKEQVRVYNVSNRNWASGEMVILNKIDGVWHPLPFGSESTGGTTAESSPTNGQWEFHTLSSTVETYFRNSAGEQFRYDEYEQAFHRAYYLPDPLNKGKYASADINNVKVDNGFVQFTSWDYLSTNVGGLRNLNGIATTLFNQDANGNPLGDNGDGKRVQGVHSAHFFGCVFPDGYDTGDKYDEYMTLTHTAIDGWGSNSSAFFKNILGTTRLFFQGASDSVSTGAVLDMFTGDNKLTNLPADIATNAGAYDGVNGRPLTDIRRLPLTHVNLRSQVELDMANGTAYHWMYREDSGLSAFDFKPTNPSRVQFRPLKVEAYASFEHTTRAGLEAKCWEWVDDVDPPISNFVTSRTGGANSIAWEAPGLPIPNTNAVTIGGLRYSRDIPAAHPISGDSLRSANVKFPSPYWGRWSDDRPAGVVGIIGAASTATAKSSIRFNADCYLGMLSWFINGAFYPSWGGAGGNGPHNMNTSMLYARVYHSWPRNQTIYDPRFFAVHHFNEGFDHINNPETLSVDTPIPSYVDRSRTLLKNTEVDSSTGLMAKADWPTNKQRRGKLLPYVYEYHTIGIHNREISSAGDGYTVGDTFTTSGGQGTGVTLVAAVIGGGPGPVNSFTIAEYDDIGHGYDGADFEGENVRIVPLSVTGTGFSGYVTNGIVYVRAGEDTKPEIATSDELLQLTPNPPLGNEGEVINELDELRSVDAQLINKSSDDQYDIFYHFHNDISHTFGDSWVFPLAWEQAVTLEVVPL
jgi:hypothetical protein